MNNKTSLTYLCLIVALCCFACSGSVKEKNNTTASANPTSTLAGAENYFTIDTTESVVTWKGSSVDGSHTGYVHISKGELLIENDQLIGGTVEINMSTIEGDDHRSDNNLINHLKDPDFFDVKKFPVAGIAIINAETSNGALKNVTGNLTIKGITHPVTFPASMEIKDGVAKANGKLTIDRTKWNVRYRSGKFYDTIADKTIADNIEFNITIVAKK